MSRAPEQRVNKQIRQLAFLIAQYSTEAPELKRRAKSEPAFQATVGCYARYFELPFECFVVVFLVCLNLVDSLIDGDKDKESPATPPRITQAANDGPSGAADEALDDLDDKGINLVMGVLWANLSQLRAISRYGVSLSELLARVREGDELALFRAVNVDRSVVACPAVARRIALAEVLDDERFMDQLARALRQKPAALTEPGRLRMMLELVLARTFPRALTQQRIGELLTEQVEQPVPGSDLSFSALKPYLLSLAERLGV